MAGAVECGLMTRTQRTVTVYHRQGLHARPAALFVQLAKQFESQVIVKKGRKIVDGKSIMGLLTLAANGGARIVVVAEGPDAREAVDALCTLLSEPLPDAPSNPRKH